MIKKPSLILMATKQLLYLLQKTRKCKGWYDMSDCGAGPCVTHEEVKAELSTREHIPRGKAYRRAMSQGKVR